MISGCSGGGKSTLLESLQAKGYRTVGEAGRRIVQNESKMDSEALPWRNMLLFLERTITLAAKDFSDASTEIAPIFFDRGLVDVILAYEHFSGTTKYQEMLRTIQYASKVYFTPPWPEIYLNDSARQHSFHDAVNEYHRLEIGYPRHGYEIHVLPKTSVENRVDLITEGL